MASRTITRWNIENEGTEFKKIGETQVYVMEDGRFAAIVRGHAVVKKALSDLTREINRAGDPVAALYAPSYLMDEPTVVNIVDADPSQYCLRFITDLNKKFVFSDIYEFSQEFLNKLVLIYDRFLEERARQNKAEEELRLEWAKAVGDANPMTHDDFLRLRKEKKGG